MNISRRDLLRLGVVGAGGLAAAGALKGTRPFGRALLPAGPGGTGSLGELMSASGIPVTPRSGWGADEALRTASPLFAPVRQIFVHHTVTTNGAPPITTIQDIYALHLSEGFDDIGYNFLIDAGGNAYEGRYSRPYPAGVTPDGQNLPGMGVVGAHVLGHDVGSVGIAMLGTFTDVLPTGAAMATLVELIAWLVDQYGLDPLGTVGGEPVVAGHRDANNTACPGNDLYTQMDAIRQGVAAAISAASTNGSPSAPTCTLLVPGWTSGITTPTVSGQVSRSAAKVQVSFSGASVLSSRTTSVVPSGGVFALTPAVLGLGLAQGTYSVSAVALDSAGNASPPTPVATGFNVVSTPLPKGYWVLGSDGGIFSYGAASFFGSTGGQPLNAPVVAMDATPAGDGYWLVAADGGIFAFGAAQFFGSMGGTPLNQPIVGISSTRTGKGYRMVAADGGIFSFGDAGFYGSTGSIRLNKPIVAMAATPSGLGYWMVATDGGIFAFGDAGFYGSTGSTPLTRPIVGMAPTPSGLGYWLVAADGGIFAFGDAVYLGSVPGLGVTDLDVVGIAPTVSGNGYYVLDASGQVFGFGELPFYGDPLTTGLTVDAIGMTIRA
jgi:hypothetical protein